MPVCPNLYWEVRCEELDKPTLHRELVRLETFKDWPCKFIEPSDLAKNGFFYNGVGDTVRCVYCGLFLNKWQEEADIMSLHEKYSKDCNFVRNIPCGNISISDDSDESSDEEQDNIIGGILVSEHKHLSKATTDSCYEINVSHLLNKQEKEELTGVDFDDDFDLHLLENRLKTFKNWPKPEIQDPKKLAEAGFIYTEIEDETVCFHCKNGLQNWTRTQHPWVEHGYFFPACCFVQIQMGMKFVRAARPMHRLLKSEEIKPGNTILELVENFQRWRLENTFNKKERIKNNMHLISS